MFPDIDRFSFNLATGAEEKKLPIELVSDAGFVVPGNNAFGRTFRYIFFPLVCHQPPCCINSHHCLTRGEKHCRDYEANSERKDTVEEFYRKQHIYQTVEFVCKTLLLICRCLKVIIAQQNVWILLFNFCR